MDTTPAPTVALYARISEDDHGTEAGVRRQLEDGRQLAATRGWTVVAEFSDNDTSAFDRERLDRRSGYHAMMAAAGRGEFGRIVCWHTSRLWRDRSERAQAIGVLAEQRVSIVAVRGPDLDLSSAYGRGMAGLLGEFDTLESEVKSERVARAALQRARDGRANGAVAYGWRRVHDLDSAGRSLGWRDVEDAEAAAVVREIVDRLLAGESIKAVRDELNRRGVPTPKGASTWGPSSVRKLAVRPANVAERVHQGEVIGAAAWPAIVDRDKHDAVVALLSNPNRTSAKATASDRRHLLTYGVGECGPCGSVLRHVVKRNRRHGRDQALYVCDRQGCVGRNAERVDELVTEVVVARLSKPDAADAFRPDVAQAAQAFERAEQLRARLDLAADQYAEGDIDGRQLARITEKLRPQVEEAQREASALAAAAGSGDVLAEVVGERAAEVWAQLDVGRRRRVLEVLGLRVRIMPTRRGPGFVPTDVEIVWSGDTAS